MENENKSPFTITVNTHKQEYLDGGASQEEKIDADGYVLFTFKEDGSEITAQGKVDSIKFAKGLLALPNADKILLSAKFLNAMNKKDEND